MLAIRPLTSARWPDLEAIFNAKGCAVARGCWCMYYRRSGSREPSATGSSWAAVNRRDLKALVDAGESTGLISYRGRTPVGWLSFGAREGCARLRRSPVMKPLDDRPVWSIICFVVPSEFRGEGVARALLDGAIAFARKRKVKLLEAYPVDKPGRSQDDSMWFGAESMFDSAGFKEVARRKPARPIVRRSLQ